MRKIERLSKDQAASLKAYQDRWISIGRSRERSPKESSEDAIERMYSVAKFDVRPKEIIWCDSPAGIATSYLERERTGKRSIPVTGWIWRETGERCWDKLSTSLGSTVLSFCRRSTEQVWDAIWRRIGNPLARLVERSCSPIMSDLIHGQHDAGSIMFYEFASKILGLKLKEMAPSITLCENVGWVLPCENVCWVCDRPVQLHLDRDGRLHKTDGPALVYQDGWGIYAIHGIRIPAWMIEVPDAITVSLIERESDTHVKRAMIAQYGTARYLQESGATLINQSRRGKLWRKERKGDTPIVMVEVVNSTPEPDGSSKTYFLRVPPHVKTATQAVAWRFGFNVVRDYHPRVES